MSQEVGSVGISKIIGGDFYTVKLKWNGRVKALGVMNVGIRIEDDVIQMNPLLIFQRMCIAKERVPYVRTCSVSVTPFTPKKPRFKRACPGI